jgi:hypothetical protein
MDTRRNKRRWLAPTVSPPRPRPLELAGIRPQQNRDQQLDDKNGSPLIPSAPLNITACAIGADTPPVHAHECRGRLPPLMHPPHCQILCHGHGRQRLGEIIRQPEPMPAVLAKNDGSQVNSSTCPWLERLSKIIRYSKPMPAVLAEKDGGHTTSVHAPNWPSPPWPSTTKWCATVRRAAAMTRQQARGQSGLVSLGQSCSFTQHGTVGNE